MRKAAQAVVSAHQLLASGDADGACNRAYYAMFDAAHAALRSANVAERLKTKCNGNYCWENNHDLSTNFAPYCVAWAGV